MVMYIIYTPVLRKIMDADRNMIDMGQVDIGAPK